MALKFIILAVTGVVLISIGIGVYFGIQSATKSALKNNLIIDGKDHKNYEGWLSDSDADDIAIYYDWYLWNLTNPSEFSAGTAAPNFEQIGPFSYRRYGWKRNVNFTNGGDGVEWQNHFEYWHSPSTTGTGLSEFTDILNVNPFYTAAVASAGNSETVLGFNFALQAMAPFFSDSATWGSNVTCCGTNQVTTPTYFAYTASLGSPQALTSTEASVLTRLQTLVGMATYAALIEQYSTAAGAAAVALASGDATTAATQQATATAIATQINAAYPGGPDFTTFFVVGTAQKTKAILLVEYLVALSDAGRATIVPFVGANGGLLYRKISSKRVIFGPDPLLDLVTGASAGFQTNMSNSETVGNRYAVKTGKNDESFLGMDHHTLANGVSTSTAYQDASGNGPTVVVDERTLSHKPFLDEAPGDILIYFEDIERNIGFNNAGEFEFSGISVNRYSGDTEGALVPSVDWNVTFEGYAPVGYWAGGIPFYIGRPHQGSTTNFTDATTGQSYNAAWDQHATYIDIEPKTGIPVAAHQRVQLNLFMNFSATTYRDAPNVRDNSKEVMIPMYILDKRFELPEKTTNTLKMAVKTGPIIATVVLAVCVAFGGILALLAVALLAKGDSPTSSSGWKKTETTTNQVSGKPYDMDAKEVPPEKDAGETPK